MVVLVVGHNTTLELCTLGVLDNDILRLTTLNLKSIDRLGGIVDATAVALVEGDV